MKYALFQLVVDKCSTDQREDYAEALQPILGLEPLTVAQWKQEYFRRRVLAAEIFAHCVNDYNLLFYISGNFKIITTTTIATILFFVVRK